MTARSKPEPLKGTVVVLAFSGSHSGVRIEVTDETSGVIAFSTEMPLADFANALFHRGTPCEYTIGDPRILGATAENKAELVPFKSSRRTKREYATDEYRTTAAVKALAPFEVDGWRGEARDLYNGHCAENGKQRVRFFRHTRDGKPVPMIDGEQHERFEDTLP